MHDTLLVEARQQRGETCGAAAWPAAWCEAGAEAVPRALRRADPDDAERGANQDADGKHCEN